MMQTLMHNLLSSILKRRQKLAYRPYLIYPNISDIRTFADDLKNLFANLKNMDALRLTLNRCFLHKKLKGAEML